ncbi:MAG: HesA/MoeB/ThiF family protein [Proteobacteria bacterium]|nr:HesA/MoeB/ThiF family protein [Pseudomonadota bacterium]
MTLAPRELARYSRHLLLGEVGLAGQERLRSARVLIVGAGGLGSPAALYLAACGVGTLGLVDFDRVELSNLQRQVLFTTADVGEPKTAAACTRLAALNPEVRLEPHARELRAANAGELVDAYDVVLDGSDRLDTRYLVNDACVLRRRPLVSAAIHRFEGQAMTYVPGRGPCYRCLFPSATDAGAESCAEAGVLGVLPGVLGTLQATEAIKLLLGLGTPLVGRLLSYDALALEFREFPFARRPDCAVCGERPTITALAEPAPACAPAAGAWRSLSANELAALLAEARPDGPPLVLIDVREPHEYAAGHLPGAQSVPLARLERALDSLAGAGTVVFVCRSGARSERACALALERGLRAPAHLAGGLLGWVRWIDPQLPLA